MGSLENNKKNLKNIADRILNGEYLVIHGKPRTGKTYTVVNILDSIDTNKVPIKIVSYLIGAYNHFGYGNYCEELNSKNTDSVFEQLDSVIENKILKIKMLEPVGRAIIVLDDCIHSTEDCDKIIRFIQKAKRANIACICSGSYPIRVPLENHFDIDIETMNEGEKFYFEVK